MRVYKTFSVNTLAEFLCKIEELKASGFHVIYTNADKRITFDGQNTVGCQVDIYATLECGSATYTVLYIMQ